MTVTVYTNLGLYKYNTVCILLVLQSTVQFSRFLCKHLWHTLTISDISKGIWASTVPMLKVSASVSTYCFMAIKRLQHIQKVKTWSVNVLNWDVTKQCEHFKQIYHDKVYKNNMKKLKRWIKLFFGWGDLKRHDMVIGVLVPCATWLTDLFTTFLVRKAQLKWSDI